MCVVDEWLEKYSWKSLLITFAFLLIFGYVFGFSRFSMFLIGFYWSLITFKSIITKKRWENGNK